jgi:hypothetical protein
MTVNLLPRINSPNKFTPSRSTTMAGSILLTTADVAAILGCSVDAIHKHAAAGNIGRKVGNAYFFQPEGGRSTAQANRQTRLETRPQPQGTRQGPQMDRRATC